MTRQEYQAIEAYMNKTMTDSAHDCQHIYRVLYTALDIAETESGADLELLVAACLLHDVGRTAQLENQTLCHAEVGSAMARAFLLTQGWPQDRADQVAACVLTHRFRTDRRPASLEAKILFDADKLDVTGAIGIGRTLCYGGAIDQPLYFLGPDGDILTQPQTPPSFFREYNYKLRGIAATLYTARAKALAQGRQAISDAYYDALLSEVSQCHTQGQTLLNQIL